MFESARRGRRYVRSTPLVLLAVAVVGLVATFGMNFQVLVPPLADDVLDVGASGYGFLMAASGVGLTAAALWIAFKRRVGPRPIVLGAIAPGWPRLSSPCRLRSRSRWSPWPSSAPAGSAWR